MNKPRWSLPVLLLFGCLHGLYSQTLDTLVFGNPASETAHALSPGWSQPAPNAVVDANNGIYPSDPSLTPPGDVVTGGLGQTARRLLPRTPNPCVYGGEMDFTMAVDPVRQNHLTIKLWGSDTSSGIWFVLNIDGKELGLRHGGDSAAPDMLFGNKQIVSFAPNQWVYRTMALPIHLTQGRTGVALKIRSMGWISDYDSGPFFGDYNKLMNSPSLGLYRIYTHLGSKLDTSGETQGPGSTPASPRTVENETTVINNIKSAVNNQLSSYLGAAPASLSPYQAAWLARCHDAKENLGEGWISYGGSNTQATLIAKVIDVIDYHVGRQANDGGYIASFGNSSWGGGFGPLGDAIRLLWPQINTGNTMSTGVAYGGSYGTISRTSGWSKALRASVDHGRYNRRSGLYANQDVIGVENTYTANRGLQLVDPANAIQESEALRYLREACGLVPWAGSDQTGGGPVPVKGTYPYGTSFYEVTSDGTTKDGGGFVGSDYGEMGSAVTRWGLLSGDSGILNRGLQMLRARAVFRFPSFDGNGYRVMQGANPIGVRNRTLPGHYGYLDRGDGAPDIAALGTAVIGADLTGYFQNGINDGQQLYQMSGGKDPCLPRNWTLAKAQAATNVLVPMAPGAPDFAWVDEENMVVAAKSGENRIFANLYWAAPDHINGWAKIFHLPANAAPEYSEVRINDVRYRPTGTFKTLGPRVEAGTRQPFDNPVSACNGVVAPQAWRSDPSTIPSNNADSGKGTGYTLRYGHWLIGINAHHADTYDMVLSSDFPSALPLTELVSGTTTTTATVTLAPKTSAVFYLPGVVDPAPRPSRPLVLTGKATATTVVLDWDDAPGAASYNVKRSTSSGSDYTTIGTAGGSSFIDTTAAAGMTYYYVVSGVSPGGEGGNSPEASASLTASGLANRATGGTASASLSNASHPPANSFDAGTGTKWNSGSTGIAAWLRYDFGPNITWAVTRYDITSADTTLRDPKDWTFQASNDGTDWTTLDTRSGETFSSRAQTKQYPLANTTGYRFYRLAVNAASGGLGYEIQLAELGIYASASGTVPPPSAPSDLTAESGNNQVFLSWSPPGGANSYVVKRGTSASGPFAPLGTTENPYFLDTTAPAPGTYHYVVAALNNGGEGAASVSTAAGFGPAAAVAPAGLAVSNGPNAGQATLKWDAAPGVPTYTIKRSTTSGGPYTTVASGISDLDYTDDGLSNGVSYHYVVSATISGIESPDSAQHSITPQSFAWNGTSANWSTASNWGGTAPENGCILIFGGTPATTSTANNLTGLDISGLVFNPGAGSFTLGGNALALSGDIISSAANTQTISLGLTLSGNRVIDVRSGQLTITGAITDAANSHSLTKSGPGTLTLTAANTFDGGLIISAGTLQVGTSTTSSASGSTASLGSAGSTVTLGSAILRFQMGSASSNTFGQNFVFNSGALLTTNDGKVTLGTGTGTIAVNGPTLVQGKWGNKWFVLGGIVSGGGDISISNTTTSHVTAVGFTNGSNTYNGTITVEDSGSGMAALAVGHDDALRFARINALNTQTGRCSVWFDTVSPVLGGLSGVSGSSIMLNTDGGLHGSGPSTSNSAVNLSVGFNNADSIYQGDLVGTGGLTKVGTGVLALAGSNAYSGATTVNGGTLMLASPLSGTGNVVVNNGAILAGDVDLGGMLVVNNGGIIAPGGAETGVLSSIGIALGQGAVLDLDLGTMSASDRISMTGGSYTAPATGQASLHLNARPGFGPGIYPLINGAAGIDANHFAITTPPPNGYGFALSSADGTLSLTVTGPPALPDGLLAYGKNGSVLLVWDSATGADSYSVYQSTSPDSGFTWIGTTTETTCDITGLTNGTACYFRITATNGLGEGGASDVVTATPQSNTWAEAPTSLDWSLPGNWGGAAPIDNSRLTFAASSATNLNNDIEGLTLGGLVFNSGASPYTISGTPVLLTGDITNNSSSAQTINLQMTLVGSRTVTTNTGAVTLGGSLDDGGFTRGLIKNGNGTLTLSGANAFTGGLTLNAGTLVLANAAASGTGGAIVLNSGTLTLAGATVYNPIHAPQGSTVSLVKSTSMSLVYGNLSGGGTINESGNTNGLHWFGDNSGFTGTITSANSGGNSRWRFNTPMAGSASASWVLHNTATDSYGFNFGTNSVISFGALSGSGYFRNNGNGTATMRIGDLGTHTTLSGTTMFGIGLLKVGAGTLTLSGSGFFHSNPTTVSAGTLNVTGAIATSPLTMENAATLSGTGSLGGTVTLNSGGNLSPGNGGAGSTGNLTLNHTFIPKTGSNLRFEIGTSSDQITLGLTSGFTAPSSGSAIIHISAGSGFAAGTYTLINNLGGGALTSQAFSIGSLPADYAATLTVNNNSLEITLRFAGADWSGNTSDLWSIASNWNGNVPIDGDKLGFTNSVHTNLTNDLSNLFLRGIIFNSGASAFTIGGNSIRLGGDIVNNSTAGQTLGFPIILTSNISVIANTGPIVLGGVISESGGGFSMTKAGTGPLTLSGANTFSGGFITTAGDTYISGLGSGTPGAPTSGALGTGIVTLAGGRIIYNNGVTALYNNLIAQAGTTTTFLEAVSQSLYLYGDLSGSGNIILDANTNYNGIRLAGDNSAFTGTVTLNSTGNSARHKFDSANAGSAAAKWILNGPNDSGSMNFGAGTIHFGELSGNANQIRNNQAGTAILSVGALNTDSTFSGVISSVGSLALEKTGGGTLTLSGTNSYTGPTAIHNGTLKFIANKNGSGTVTVNSGGTLAGTATVAGPVTVNAGGAITPGNNGAGTLTLSGTTTLTGGGVLKLDLGTTSDLLSLTGTYAGPAAGTVTVNVNALAGFTTGTYPLITGAAGISAASFSIGDFPAGFTGSFTASSGTLSLVVVDLPAPASLVAVGGVNQITLDWPPVPGALHYEVRRSLDSGSGFNPIAAPAGDAFADTTVSNGVTYFYQVAAVNGSTGPPSSVASAVAVPPLTPEELAGPPVTLDGNGVRLGLAASVVGRIYQLQRSTTMQAGFWVDVGPAAPGNGGPLVLEDMAPPLPKCFYRVLITP